MAEHAYNFLVGVRDVDGTPVGVSIIRARDLADAKSYAAAGADPISQNVDVWSKQDIDADSADLSAVIKNLIGKGFIPPNTTLANIQTLQTGNVGGISGVRHKFRASSPAGYTGPGGGGEAGDITGQGQTDSASSLDDGPLIPALGSMPPYDYTNPDPNPSTGDIDGDADLLGKALDALGDSGKDDERYFPPYAPPDPSPPYKPLTMRPAELPVPSSTTLSVFMIWLVPERGLSPT
jgi:hypothetical protein